MVMMEEIARAGERIAQLAVRTPLIRSDQLSEMLEAEIHLKLENLQRTGSFKIRGATNKINALLEESPDELRKSGVVAASAGNHAQGVALAASRAGVRTTIVMPKWAPVSKQVATAGYGSELVLHGESLEEALAKAEEYVVEGAIYVHPYDDKLVIAGQGTVGAEICEELDGFDEVWVPVGGGGLIGGIGAAVKATRPEARVIGVESETCAAASGALAAGYPVKLAPGPTVADGIAVAQVGALPFSLISEHVDEIHTVTEADIMDGVLTFVEQKKIVVEGAAASPLAALFDLHRKDPAAVRGKRLVLVVSGGNIDTHTLGKTLERALNGRGRLLQFSTVLTDRPGSLARLINLLGENHYNILGVRHDRHATDLPPGSARVGIEVESRGGEHSRMLIELLVGAGYPVDVSRYGI